MQINALYTDISAHKAKNLSEKNVRNVTRLGVSVFIRVYRNRIDISILMPNNETCYASITM